MAKIPLVKPKGMEDDLFKLFKSMHKIAPEKVVEQTAKQKAADAARYIRSARLRADGRL